MEGSHGDKRHGVNSSLDKRYPAHSTRRRFGNRRGVTCGVLAGDRAFRHSLEYQARRFGTGKIRHNTLRSAFGTYAGFPWPSALGLMEGCYRISHGEMRFCRAFHEFTCPSRVSGHRAHPPLNPVAPHLIDEILWKILLPYLMGNGCHRTLKTERSRSMYEYFASKQRRRPAVAILPRADSCLP